MEVSGAEGALWVSVAVAGVQLDVAFLARPAVEPDSEGGSAQDGEDEEISLNLSTGSATIQHKPNIHSHTSNHARAHAAQVEHTNEYVTHSIHY